MTKLKTSAAILVLGDLNRSPRMLNHSKAIADVMSEIDEVSLIGFDGGPVRSDIANESKIKLYYIPEKINNYLKKLPKILFLLSALIRIVLQIVFLTYTLFTIPRPRFLILQNPPGIPAIYICSVVCFMRRTTFIIDWHNYGYSILDVNSRSKIIVFFAKMYEKIYGRCADLHFCVSEAMKKHLKQEMNINAINLPDRAMKNVFKRLNSEEALKLFRKYDETKEEFSGDNKLNPILMISSTSWTPDEDFDLLLEGIKETDSKLIIKNKTIPIKKVIFLITGRGPNRNAFLKKVDETSLMYFKIKSVWLESDDYSKILGAADLGVCLHYSSSGFDLPMKVVDMFSAQLPVATYDYDTVHELVEKNKNGFLFKTKNELAKIIEEVIIDYSQNDKSTDIDTFRNNLKKFSKIDWISQWKDVAYGHIKSKFKKIKQE